MAQHRDIITDKHGGPFIWLHFLCPWGEKGKFFFATWGFPGGASGKNSSCQCRRCRRVRFSPRVGKIPRRRAWHPTPVLLPVKPHGQRSLAGYRPWGPKELDTTEHVCTHIYSVIYTAGPPHPQVPLSWIKPAVTFYQRGLSICWFGYPLLGSWNHCPSDTEDDLLSIIFSITL